MAWRVDERIIYEGTQMTLKVAVQMDPMHAIKIAGDSTFYLLLAAQQRGHELFHYLAPDLNFRDGCFTARAFPVPFEALGGAHRSEARSVGTECFGTFISQLSP